MHTQTQLKHNSISHTELSLMKNTTFFVIISPPPSTHVTNILQVKIMVAASLQTHAENHFDGPQHKSDDYISLINCTICVFCTKKEDPITSSEGVLEGCLLLHFGVMHEAESQS